MRCPANTEKDSHIPWTNVIQSILLVMAHRETSRWSSLPERAKPLTRRTSPDALHKYRTLARSLDPTKATSPRQGFKSMFTWVLAYRETVRLTVAFAFRCWDARLQKDSQAYSHNTQWWGRGQLPRGREEGHKMSLCKTLLPRGGRE